MEENPLCVICAGEIDADNIGVSSGRKGIQTLLESCQARGEDGVFVVQGKILSVKLIRARISESDKVVVHVGCRKRFTDLRNVTTEDEHAPPAKKTRSSMEAFQWKRDCFFCGTICDTKHDNDVKTVETISLRNNVLDVLIDVCNEYPEDDEIKHRVLNCSDLVAKNAIYHGICMANFYKKRRNQVQYNNSSSTSSSHSVSMGDEETTENNSTLEKRSVGRPGDSLMSEAFIKTCEWLESHAEPTSLCEFEEHMVDIVDAAHMCSRKYLRTKLVQKYGDHIEFISDGYRDILCFKRHAQTYH